MRASAGFAAVFLTALGALSPAVAAEETPELVEVDGVRFGSWSEYFRSDYFRASGKRCGLAHASITIPAEPRPGPGGNPADCGASNTDPNDGYVPDVVFEIPVVVHIIQHTNGQGNISDQLVESQIQALNEDFMALQGSNGGNGATAEIRFRLATTDPDGNTTNGITRSTDDQWFDDNGGYFNTLAWDPNNYLNIYTNNPFGNGTLGYVPWVPQQGLPGSASDRIVIFWRVFGVPAIGGPPYDLGRTVTHEVGHFLGLHHPFRGECAPGTPPGCYQSGDLICDTNSEQVELFGCPVGSETCASPDPVDNYMSYTDDSCMERFTGEQVRRMRCTLMHYRATLYHEKPTPTISTSWSSIKNRF